MTVTLRSRQSVPRVRRRELRDLGGTLGGTSFEELHDARQTVRNVTFCHTTGVEGTHGQLGAGLANGLRGDNADRLTDSTSWWVANDSP